MTSQARSEICVTDRQTCAPAAVHVSRLDRMASVAGLVASWQARSFRDILIERSGLSWTVWFDFVGAPHAQPRFSSLSAARAAISEVLR